MLRRFCAPWLAVIALTAVLSPAVHAELKLGTPFTDNMVLQRDMKLPVWGWDTPGTKVTVKLNGTEATAEAGENGKWQATLNPQKAGGPHEVTIEGTTSQTLKNVLVGEVWFCSGQSNMEWPVQASDNAKEEIASADHPMIRHIKIPHTPTAEPQDTVNTTGWTVCSPKTVASYTAVGYFFARKLQQELDVPVGLIGCNWGGTRIEPWTPPAGFKAVDELKSITDNLDKFPLTKNDGKINHQTPLALYNGMVSPLVPYSIRGALWYQGESNNGEGMLYHHKMRALIEGWRTLWSNDALPFYFVQLAPYKYGGDPTRLAGIWEAQTATLSVPHTGMAVTVDIGNVTDIHPRNKQDVGKRLALWALTNEYGKEGIVYSGPLYKSMKVDGSKAILSFDHVGDGLVSRDDKPLTWFAVAGEDKKFVDATATIEGDTVVVHAEGVEKPVAVRFGWHQEAEPNLSNKNGLPASPFRTDKW